MRDKDFWEETHRWIYGGGPKCVDLRASHGGPQEQRPEPPGGQDGYSSGGQLDTAFSTARLLYGPLNIVTMAGETASVAAEYLTRQQQRRALSP